MDSKRLKFGLLGSRASSLCFEYSPKEPPDNLTLSITSFDMELLSLVSMLLPDESLSGFSITRLSDIALTFLDAERLHIASPPPSAMSEASSSRTSVVPFCDEISTRIVPSLSRPIMRSFPGGITKPCFSSPFADGKIPLSPSFTLTTTLLCIFPVLLSDFLETSAFLCPLPTTFPETKCLWSKSFPMDLPVNCPASTSITASISNGSVTDEISIASSVGTRTFLTCSSIEPSDVDFGSLSRPSLCSLAFALFIALPDEALFSGFKI